LKDTVENPLEVAPVRCRECRKRLFPEETVAGVCVDRARCIELAAMPTVSVELGEFVGGAIEPGWRVLTPEGANVCPACQFVRTDAELAPYRPERYRRCALLPLCTICRANGLADAYCRATERDCIASEQGIAMKRAERRARRLQQAWWEKAVAHVAVELRRRQAVAAAA